LQLIHIKNHHPNAEKTITQTTVLLRKTHACSFQMTSLSGQGLGKCRHALDAP
jgi:hypothetical protein